MLRVQGIYKYIVQWGAEQAPSTLTGFGYLLAKGVAQAVEEGGLLERLYRRCNRRRRRYLRRDFLRLSGGAYFQAQTQRVIGTIPPSGNRARHDHAPAQYNLQSQSARYRYKRRPPLGRSRIAIYLRQSTQ